MKTTLFRLLALVALFAVVEASADDSSLDLPFPAEQETSLAAALRGEAALGPYLFTPAPKPADERLERVWLGTKASMELLLGVKIRYEKEGSGVPLELPFGMSLTFQKEKLLLESELLGPKLTRGALLPLNPDRVAKYGFRGGRGMSLAVLVLPVKDAKRTTAVVLCTVTKPDPNRAREGGWVIRDPKALQKFGPVPASVSFHPQASADGEFLSGIERGLAEVRVTTSRTITPSDPPFDRVLAKNPRLSAGYQTSSPPTVVEFGKEREVRGAVELALTYHSPAGYKRRETETAATWVRVQEPDPTLTSHVRSATGIQASTHPINCVTVTWARGNRVFYTREPLPEDSSS